MGLSPEHAKTNLKLEERIIEKAARPEILARKPWHDVEHIRDALRFKTVSSTFEDCGKAQGIVLKETDAQVVKLDAEAVLSAAKQKTYQYNIREMLLDNQSATSKWES